MPIPLKTPYSAGVHPTAITQPYNIVRFPNAAHKELHNEWMKDEEYRAAWQEEERKEKLRALLSQWR